MVSYFASRKIETISIVQYLVLTSTLCLIASTENTHRWGELSLYSWSPVLQAWVQLLHYKQLTTLFLFLVKYSLVKLETSCTVILPPSVMWLRSAVKLKFREAVRSPTCG